MQKATTLSIQKSKFTVDAAWLVSLFGNETNSNEKN